MRTAIPHTAHDATTAPASYPFQARPAPAVPPVAEPPRAKPVTNSPPIEEIDEGWDLGDEDPTAASDTALAAADADAQMERQTPNTPSSSEMAGDGSTGGDGIDEPGWD